MKGKGTMDEALTYVHQHAVGFAIGFGVFAWWFGHAYSEGDEEKSFYAWGAGVFGVAAAVVFIWHLADPWIKDEELVKPLAMIEEVRGRLKLNPDDKAAKQAWQMIRDKMAEVDPEVRACAFARRNVKSAYSGLTWAPIPEAPGR